MDNMKGVPYNQKLPWFERHSEVANHIVTRPFQGGMPYQGWFKFKEAFSPKLISDCASTLPRRPRSCFDPFGGSGTTAITAQFLGIKPSTIEVNPFLADLIESKLITYNIVNLRKDYIKVQRSMSEKSVDCLDVESGVPATFIEPGRGQRWIYSKKTAARIAAYAKSIGSVSNRNNQILLKIVLGSILVQVSNVVINGKGRRYRRHWQKRQSSPQDVDVAFSQAFHRIYEDICLHQKDKISDYTVLRGDCREKVDNIDAFDFAVMSPPYPNSFDYTDIYNIELWMLGYLTSKKANTTLRKNTLRSHVQIHREYEANTLDSVTLKKVYKKLCGVRHLLWNSHIPEMVCAYFHDMISIIGQIKPRLNRRGRVFIAAGNSKYAGVSIDVGAILSELSQIHCGFRQVDLSSIRSMRVSPQQGGQKELKEYLITLS